MYVCVRGRLSPTLCSRYRYGTAAKIHFTVRPIPQNCGIGNYKPGEPKPSRSVCVDYPGSVAAASDRRVKWIFTHLIDAAPPQCHGCDGSRSLFPSRSPDISVRYLRVGDGETPFPSYSQLCPVLGDSHGCPSSSLLLEGSGSFIRAFAGKGVQTRPWWGANAQIRPAPWTAVLQPRSTGDAPALRSQQ